MLTCTLLRRFKCCRCCSFPAPKSFTPSEVRSLYAMSSSCSLLHHCSSAATPSVSCSVTRFKSCNGQVPTSARLEDASNHEWMNAKQPPPEHFPGASLHNNRPCPQAARRMHRYQQPNSSMMSARHSKSARSPQVASPSAPGAAAAARSAIQQD